CSRFATGTRTEHGEKVAQRQYGAATPGAETHAAEVAESGRSAVVWTAQGIGGTGLGSAETTAWHAAVSAPWIGKGRNRVGASVASLQPNPAAPLADRLAVKPSIPFRLANGTDMTARTSASSFHAHPSSRDLSKHGRSA